MLSRRSRRPRGARANTIGALLLVSFAFIAATAEATPYSIVPLDTSGFGTGGVAAVDNGTAAGGVFKSAGVWYKPGQFTPLASPANFISAGAFGIAGTQEAGWGLYADHNPRALLWNGTSAPVQLSATISKALATDGSQQVGTVVAGAALWSGTSGSYVDLSPPPQVYSSSTATGVWDEVQVGYGGDIPFTDALLWHGTSESYTVLKTGAEALGISRGQVVGFSRGGTLQAALWTSYSPASYVNLAPANTTASEIFATNGVQQVGDVSLTQGSLGQLPLDHHPGVWHGTASSFQFLPLPQGDNYGVVYGIDGDGNIVGTVSVQNAGSVSTPVPVMWTQPHLPGDANFDGSVGFDDLVIVAHNYGTPGEWVNGDFNGDGKVGFDDLVILASNYGKSMTALAPTYIPGPPVLSVPEPSPLSLLACALAFVLPRRRCRG